MPSDDDRTTRLQTPGFLTGDQGETLEPFIDPAENVAAQPGATPPSAADAVDAFLSDDDVPAGGMIQGLEFFESVEAAPPEGVPEGSSPAVAERRPEDLGEPDESIVRSQRTSKLRLGDILKQMGLVTDEQVENALANQKDTRKRLGQVLLEEGIVTQLDLTKALAQKFGVSFLDLTSTRFDGAATAYIDEKLARRYGAVPVRFLDDNTLLVAMIDPQNLPAQEDLAIITGFPIQPAIASEEDVFGAIAKFYREKADVGESTDGSVAEGDEESITDIREATEEAPIVKLVNYGDRTVRRRLRHRHPLRAAGQGARRAGPRRRRAARDHVHPAAHAVGRAEPPQDHGRPRHRRAPRASGRAHRPHGRRQAHRHACRHLADGVRREGRHASPRQVERDARPQGPRLRQKALKRFRRSFTKPYGAILVTGPTGSGKSTTLYAALNILNSPEKNIITVEDPVEYRLTGINQVQVNTRAGMTFAAALRSILRCDPDIVMIGEIRDRETAMIAVESALTGHLVLSTLHTNDAPGALSRLTEMGIEPFLTSSAVDAVLAQRLARRLCKTCKEPFTATQEMLRKNDFPPEVCDRDDVVLYRAKGCSRCNNTGYKGRLGLYEVMVVSEAIRRLTVERKSADEIGRVAAAEGMKSLREDGIDKVLLGMTSVEEIARVII